MSHVAQLMVLVVALEHVGFLFLEMFLWNTAVGRKIFRTTPEAAQSSATLAANQGLYNGFLATGLVWALLRGDIATVNFFLVCVIVAGVFGALTVTYKIFFVQALPAAAALTLVASGSL